MSKWERIGGMWSRLYEGVLSKLFMVVFFTFILLLAVGGFWNLCTNTSPEYIEYCTVYGC